MNPQDTYLNPPPPTSPIKNPLAVMQPGESVICEIKRHPIGMIGIYVMSGVLMVVLAVLAFIVAPNFITGASRSQVTEIGALAFLIIGLLTVGFVYISNTVYWGNRWVLTSDSITQMTQTSLFDKQSSQLSLGNLEDVTAEQNGVMTHMFNYGVLRVETAGERSKFLFLYCPNPSYYAQCVLKAREEFEQGRRAADPQQLYRGQGSYQQTSAPAAPVANPLPPTANYPADGVDNGVNIGTEQ